MAFILSGVKSFARKATKIVGAVSAGLDDAAKISSAIHQAMADVNDVIQKIGNSYADNLTASEANVLLGQMRTLATVSRAADLSINFPERQVDLQAMTKGQLVDFLNAASDALSVKAARIPSEFSSMSAKYSAGDIDVYTKYRAALADRLAPSTVTDYDQIWNRAVKIRSAKLGNSVTASPAEQLAIVKGQNANWLTMSAAINNRLQKVASSEAAGESRTTEIGFTTVPLSPNGLAKGNGLKCEAAFLSINSRMQPALCTDMDSTVYEALLPSGSTEDEYGTVGDNYAKLVDQYNKLKMASYDPSHTIGLSGRFAFDRASASQSYQEHMVPSASFNFGDTTEKMILLGEAHFHRNETLETRTDATTIQSSIRLASNMAVLHPDSATGLMPGSTHVLPDLIDAHSMRTCDVPGENFNVTQSPDDAPPARFDGIAMLISLSKMDYARGVLNSAVVQQVSDVSWELESYIRGSSDLVVDEQVHMVDGIVRDAESGRELIKMGCGYDQTVGRSMNMHIQNVLKPVILSIPQAPGAVEEKDVNELVPSNPAAMCMIERSVGSATMPIASLTDAATVNGAAGQRNNTLAVPANFNDGTNNNAYYSVETNGLRDKRIDAGVTAGHLDANHDCGKAVVKQMKYGSGLTIDSDNVPIHGTNGTSVGHSSLGAAIYRLDAAQPLVCERASDEVLMVWVFPDPSATFEVAEAPSMVMSDTQASALTLALTPAIASSVAARARDGYSDLTAPIVLPLPSPVIGNAGALPKPKFAPIFSSGLGRPPNVTVLTPEPSTDNHTPGGAVSGFTSLAAYGGRIVFGSLPLAKAMPRTTNMTTISTPDIGADLITGRPAETLAEALINSAHEFPGLSYNEVPRGNYNDIYEMKERRRQVSTYGPMFRRYGVLTPMQFAYGHVIPTLRTNAHAVHSLTTRALQSVTLETGATTIVSIEKVGVSWFYRGGESFASLRDCPSTTAHDRAASLMLMRRDASSEVAVQKMKTPVPPNVNLSGVFDVEQKDGTIRPEWHELTGSLEDAINTYGPLNRTAIGFNSSGLSASVGTGTIYSALKRSVDTESWKELGSIYREAGFETPLPDDPEALYYMSSDEFNAIADGLALIGTTSARI